jgi:hypothetical protein
MLATTSPAAQLGFPPRPPLPPLEPGPWALTRAAVDKWLATAKPGDETVYARGAWLLQSDGVEKLQEVHDAGGVTFKRQKISEGDHAYIVERLRGDTRPSPRARLMLRARATETDDELADLLALLRRLAGRDLPCLTNRELGAEIGGANPDRVAYLLGILIREARITVESLAPGKRVVTILSTGKKTRAV